MSVEAGLSACIERTVTELDTAAALGSGDLEVLGSPRLLAWAEAACLAAVDASLDATETTVGARIQIEHLQPTAVGESVTISAELERVEGRRLTFAVEASARHGKIVTGRVVRVLVDRERFLERTRE